MPKTRNMVKRTRSIRNIRTVTKAMQTVSAARFKVAYDRILSFTPFGTQLMEMVADLLLRSGVQPLRHPLLEPPEGLRHEVLLVITSNRGLCGSYNAGVLRLAMQRLGQLREAKYDVELHVAGSRGVRYLAFRGMQVDKVYEDPGDVPEYDRVAALADEMISQFLGGRISGLEAAYTQFVSPGQQRPVIAQVLPVSDLPTRKGDVDGETRMLYDFLPAPGVILRRLLPATVRLRLYQCFLDAGATEQFMRRSAMQAATDNADEMIHELKIRANRMRQRQITTELAEIMGGRVGLGKG